MTRYLPLITSALLALPALAQNDEKPSEANVFVALDGVDSNPGIESKPKATIQGALQTIRDFRDEGMITPDVKVNIWIRGGIYRPKGTIVLGSDDEGTEDAPIRISAYKDETVIFDSGIPIPRENFKPAGDPEDLSQLPDVAHGKVIRAIIDDDRAASQLAQNGAQISFAERMLTPARFPNIGFATFGSILSSDKPKTTGSLDAPVGAKVRLKPSSQQDWAGALASTPHARLHGYMCSDWLKETQQVVAAGSGNDLQLVNGSPYGISPGRRIGRVFIENLLCELDSPGEWFFDPERRALYLWPTGELAEDEAVSVWAGTNVVDFSGSSFVHLENIVFQNLHNSSNGTGAVNFKGGHHNEARGCTFRNIASPTTAFNISGTSNGVRSCDIYDVGNASRLGGGSLSPESITPSGNFIENCHFTQIFSKSFYGKVSGIGGAGTIFRNNLVHNHNGQIVTIAGADHLVEFNEVFNSGVEEGDGGCFYQGAMLWSWGNTIRNNFFHHIICNPGMYSRAAIFSDDGDMGDDVIGNVFFKAGEGFKMNGGSGHYAADNISIEGIHAFQVLAGRPDESYRKMMNYLKDKPTSGDKDNLIGRALGVFGNKGWADEVTPENWITLVSPYWVDRYPRMLPVFQDWQRSKKSHQLNTFENNTFYGYSGNPLAIPKSCTTKGNKTRGRTSGFVDTDSLNFAVKSGANKGVIPFEKIGLYKDSNRTNPPSKDLYRSTIAKHWKDTRSAPSGSYEPAKVNKRVYYNTGLVIARLAAPDLAPDLKVSVD